MQYWCEVVIAARQNTAQSVSVDLSYTPHSITYTQDDEHSSLLQRLKTNKSLGENAVSINQSTHIYTALCIASESEACVRWQRLGGDCIRS